MGVKTNRSVMISVMLSAIGFVIAFAGFGQFANNGVSSTHLYDVKEYAPHILTGVLCFVNMIFMSIHSTTGYKTLGLICALIALFSIFIAGVSFDKDCHTITFGWQEPGKIATYTDPVPANVFDFAGNHIFNCDAKALIYNQDYVTKTLNPAQACKDIRLSAAGNVIYVVSCFIALIGIPLRMQSKLPAERNYLMFVSLLLLICGWIIEMVGLAILSHKYDNERSFGKMGSLTYIPNAQLWNKEVFASPIIFTSLGGVLIFVAIYSIWNISIDTVVLTAVATGIVAWSAGASFGYTARIIHSGFRTNMPLWGAPFGQQGPVPCGYNSDMSDACKVVETICGGSVIAFFGLILLYLSCYFSVTGDIVFGQLHAQAWFNGKVWLTSYPLVKETTFSRATNQVDPVQGALSSQKQQTQQPL